MRAPLRDLDAIPPGPTSVIRSPLITITWFRGDSRLTSDRTGGPARIATPSAGGACISIIEALKGGDSGRGPLGESPGCREVNKG